MTTPDRAAQTADLRIDVVKRELNQGALAGFDSSVTDYAARLVVAALDSFDAAALAAEYGRGLADGRTEGRRQATEGWDRDLRFRHADGVTVPLYEQIVDGFMEMVRRTERQYETPPGELQQRLVGPWVPAEGGTP